MSEERKNPKGRSNSDPPPKTDKTTPAKKDTQQRVVNANDISSFGNLNRLRNIEKTKKVDDLLNLKSSKSTPSLGPHFKPNMAVSKAKPSISTPIIQYKPKTQPVQLREIKRKVPKNVDMLVESTGEMKREKRVFNIDEIAPTALEMGLDAMNLSHPVTIPFMVTSKLEASKQSILDNNSMDVEGSKMNQSHTGDIYQSQVAITEGQERVKTSIAENLFRSQNSYQGTYYGENELLFFQFPSILPFDLSNTQPAKEEKDAGERMRYDNGYPNTLQSIKEGKIGKIYILKSGKVKLKIGDNLFDISQGMPCGFLQELHSVNTNSSEMCHLGDINKRAVISPDIEALMRNV